jgi:hypothetical protein
MAKWQSWDTTSEVTIDATAKAARATLYSPDGREVSFQGKPTYATANTFTPVATATDLIRITGSATKTVRIISIYLATTTSTAGGLSVELFLIKRGQDNQGGTFVPSASCPLDSNDAAATAVCGHYTANPGLGASYGTYNRVRWATPVAVPTSFGAVQEDAGRELIPWNANTHLDKLLTLRGVNEIFVVNYNGAALNAGQTHAYRVTWIEE